MPTYFRTPSFDEDIQRLTETQRAAFRAAVRKLVDDRRRGQIRPGLRVRRVRRREGVWPHIVWRRVPSGRGGHDILDNP